MKAFMVMALFEASFSSAQSRSDHQDFATIV
jgi:hypothetical protein